MTRILIVDDEENILRALRRLLLHTPCSAGGKTWVPEVDVCVDPRTALEKARQVRYDLVISDYRMPGLDGVAFLKEFRKLQPDAARLILSGYADLNGLISAINEVGILRFVSKPWNDYDLIATLGQVFAYQELQAETARLAEEARVARGEVSAEEVERRRLEAEEPGITDVTWGPDGSVVIDPDLLKD